MKVLITGAGGFIGSHLVEHCIKEGYDVRAFIHYNSNNNWGWLETSDIKEDVEVVLGDIRDFDSVYSATKSVDAIFHLAALIGIPYSYESPLAYIRTNIQGTYNILESAKLGNIEQTLVTSTSEIYGTARYTPIDENHPVFGQSPYSASKIGADQITLSYCCSYNLPVKIIRPFNAYGPRQSARAIIPAIIIQILAGRNKIKLGNLKPTRDFTYVKDTVLGFLEIFKADGLFGDVTNLGMNEEISIGDLVKIIMEMMNVDIKIAIEDKRIRPDQSEVERLRCDNTKILSRTKWKPKYSLKDGLSETISWITENIDHYKTEIYSV